MSPWQAGRRRHSHSHSPGSTGLAALAGDAQARNRRLWASAGLAYVGAVALYVRGIPFRRGNVRTKKKTRSKQNKLKSSQSTNLIYALYAHKNVKNCFATAPAPCCLLPAPPNHLPHMATVCDALSATVSCSLSLSLFALLDMDLGC